MKLIQPVGLLIRKRPAKLPMTDEQFEDCVVIGEYVFRYRERERARLLDGTGRADPRGIMNEGDR